MYYARCVLALFLTAVALGCTGDNGTNSNVSDQGGAPIRDSSQLPDTETPDDSLADVVDVIDLTDPTLWPDPAVQPEKKIAPYIAYDYMGRNPANREPFLKQAGGNAASEAAVAAALKWLASHQYPDGSWDFDHTDCPACRGRCPHAGDMKDAHHAATALGLLPFLGAGQTHIEGKYKATVRAGLNYLVREMEVGDKRGTLEEPGGQMYSHGLGAIAVCEAYAMTRDKGLLHPAQLALNHIEFAQDPFGGGWRYTPKQPGDTSVLSWQVMALHSGHVAILTIDADTLKGVTKFLDSVQYDNGAKYGYTQPGIGSDANTAIGLWCRMYLGWPQKHPALQDGVKFLSDKGPSKTDMYFNYYATQVMRHYDGAEWKRWNKQMRDHLVDTQAKQSHITGSWYFGGEDLGAAKGGRLYATSLATLILEVYYRHKRIYPVHGPEIKLPY